MMLWAAASSVDCFLTRLPSQSIAFSVDCLVFGPPGHWHDLLEGICRDAHPDADLAQKACASRVQSPLKSPNLQELQEPALLLGPLVVVCATEAALGAAKAFVAVGCVDAKRGKEPVLCTLRQGKEVLGLVRAVGQAGADGGPQPEPLRAPARVPLDRLLWGRAAAGHYFSDSGVYVCIRKGVYVKALQLDTCAEPDAQQPRYDGADTGMKS